MSSVAGRALRFAHSLQIQLHPGAPSSKLDPAAPGAFSALDLKSRKVILGRVALVLLGPLLFFGALEIGLRVAGYGDPVTFFRPVEIDGRTYHVENPYFGQRFFRRHLPRVPAWNLIPPPTPGVPRIAVIGESAAQGYPLQNIGLASMLEGILEIQYPGRRFDFINACMTSVNSHVLTEVIPEVIAQKPDVAIFYMGNNEVVGPYGPGTPFTAWVRSPWIVWLDKKLRATRSYQLLERFLLSVASAPKSWGGFEMFADLKVPADSPALHDAYRAFERNLETMVDSLLDAGSRVVLCTIAVNLADWGPSGDEPAPPGSSAAAEMEQGRLLLAEGRTAEAVASLESAAVAAPESAQLQFLLGRALRAAGRDKEASAALRRARDLDRHRFRADTRINDIIRAVAARHAGRDVVLIDADRDLVGDGVPGKGEFTEHVHFNFEGMRRLGLLVAGALPALLPSLGDAQPCGDVEITALRERIFFTPFDEVLLASVARDVGQMGIFRDRPGSADAFAYLDAAEKSLRANHPLDAAQLRAAYTRSGALRPGDPRLEASYADYLSRMSLTEEAAAAGQRVLARKPTYFEGYRFMADAAKSRGDTARARELYLQALGVYRLIPDARKNLGDLARDSGDPRAAEKHYAAAFQMDAGNVAAALALAEIEANTSRRAPARQTLEAAARHNPQDASVRVALARLENAEGNYQDARRHWEKALELDSALSPRDLLRLVAERFSAADSLAAFSGYESRFGEEHDLYNNYAWLLATAPQEGIRDPAAALRLARRAIELSPEPNAYYHGTLAASFAAAGDFEAARSNVQKAIGLAAEDPALRDQLAAMRKSFEDGQIYLETPPVSAP